MSPLEKSLYLTFDDGPIPGPTEFVLDELRKAGVKVTFFCIGDNVRKHPDIFRRILAEGHGVGNHTFHHVSGWKTRVADYVDNVAKCDDVMLNTGEFRPTLFRPPYGRITRRQIASIATHQVTMWDVLTNDYAAGLAPNDCLRGSLAATRHGSIVVFHDSLKAEKNLTFVLPRYLEHFQRQGYEFKLLS